MDALTEARDLIRRHCEPGRWQTAVPRMTLIRSDLTTSAIPTTYAPVFCIIVQGRKRVILGERLLEYDAAKYLVVSVDLPVTGQICDATSATPYLAFSLRLEPAMLASLLLDMPGRGEDAKGVPGLAVSTLTADLIDPVLRLLRLLDRPQDIAMLAPLVEREILYRLLEGEQGAMLRQIALADSRLSQVSRAIEWIKRHYAEPFRIQTVADLAHMSPSSLHRHFKAVTAMSPLQFQKQIRLQEARRLMLVNRADAASIGFSVGYESTSQFTREYSRLFGAPPARVAARLRDVSGADRAAVAQ